MKLETLESSSGKLAFTVWQRKFQGYVNMAPPRTHGMKKGQQGQGDHLASGTWREAEREAVASTGRHNCLCTGRKAHLLRLGKPGKEEIETHSVLPSSNHATLKTVLNNCVPLFPPW